MQRQRQLSHVTRWLGCAAILSSVSAHASVYGTLSNFDVFNNSTGNYYGFEIELEGISSSQVPNYNGQYYTYPNWHYGMGTVSDTATGVSIRYYKPGDPAAFTPAFTGNIAPTSGHSCITLSGCEHFGVSLNGNPTKTSYFWLDQAGNRSTQVNLLAPSWNVVQAPVPAVIQNGQVVQPAVPAVVHVEVEAPEAPANQRSDAVWVKVFKRELENPVPLDALMADNANVPDVDNNNPGETEIEWKLFQRDPNNPDKNILENDPFGEEIPDDKHQVLRTYSIYEFAGTYDPSHEAICTEVGNCEDLAANGVSHLPYVGKLIGQQMGALNLDGAVAAPVPIPASAPLFFSALTASAWLARRNAKNGKG